MTFCSSEKPFLPWPTLCAKLTQSLFLRKIKARATSGLKSFFGKKMAEPSLSTYFLLACLLTNAIGFRMKMEHDSIWG